MVGGCNPQLPVLAKLASRVNSGFLGFEGPTRLRIVQATRKPERVPVTPDETAIWALAFVAVRVVMLLCGKPAAIIAAVSGVVPNLDIRERRLLVLAGRV
jgi:hypothetical protein